MPDGEGCCASLAASQYPPIGRAAIWTLYFVILVDFFQLTFVFPFIPSLVASFGGSEKQTASQVAALSSIAAFTEMVANPILGSVSDRFGRKVVMLVACLGSAASSAGLGFSKSFVVAVIFRVVNSASGGTAAIANTYMADVTSAQERPIFMAKITSLIGIGIAVGPIVGGYLYKVGGIEFACLSASGISVFNFLCVLFFLKESKPSRPAAAASSTAEGATPANTGEGLEEPEAESTPAEAAPRAPAAAAPRSSGWLMYLLYAANLFVSPMSVIFDTFANLYVTDKYYDGDEKKGTTLFSNCMAMIGIWLVIIPAFIYQPFLRIVGFKGSIVVGAGCIAVGLLGNGYSPEPMLFLGSTALWAIGFQLMGPAIPVMITQLATPETYGRTFGFYMSVGNASRVLGPAVLTPVYSWRHDMIFFVMSASIVIMACFLLAVASLLPPLSQDDEASEAGGAPTSEEFPPPRITSKELTRQLSRVTSGAAVMYGNLQTPRGPTPASSPALVRRSRTTGVMEPSGLPNPLLYERRTSAPV